MKPCFVLLLALVTPIAMGQSSGGRSDDRWNITGPNWYETKCGQAGYSVTPRAALQRQASHAPVRSPSGYASTRRVTFSYIADPDQPCERMINPQPEGGLVRTYIKTWN